MRVVIAGGGTGGHIFPALAVGSEFVKRGVEIVFVGTKKGLESELVPKRGWSIEYLSVPRWKGEGKVIRLVKVVVLMPLAVLRALVLIGRIRPDAVLGVGGYASAPVVIAAFLRGVPTLLMEQNSIPGLTNRILSRVATRICISFPASAKYFKERKVVVTGNPVREEIRDVGGNLPTFQDKFVLMCFGGSQGAKKLNEALFSSLKYLRSRRSALKIIHQVGFNMDADMARDIYGREGFDAEVYRFIDDIADCYSRAHMVICRAGATSIAELQVVARPAILVPYPFAANDHQKENARYVVAGGGAIMVLNEDLDGEKIAELVVEFMSHPEKLSGMGEAMKRMAKPDAAEMIVEECLKLYV